MPGTSAQQISDCLREVPGTVADINQCQEALVAAGSIGGGGGKVSSQVPANLNALDRARTSR